MHHCITSITSHFKLNLKVYYIVHFWVLFILQASLKICDNNVMYIFCPVVPVWPPLSGKLLLVVTTKSLGGGDDIVRLIHELVTNTDDNNCIMAPCVELSFTDPDTDLSWST